MANSTTPDKLLRYRQGDAPLPGRSRLWPLYGAGFERLGRGGQPIEVPIPHCGPDELLVRHDACGLCFSDCKVIRTGQEHPRIYHDMQADPVVLGHEVCMTVVGVGEKLRAEYQVGDRIIVQPDIYLGGVGFAYGYEIQGGLSQYGVIDQRVLQGDHGNYLVPIQPRAGYAEAALTEPWACVNAAYHLKYRTGLKRGGTTWIVASPKAIGDRPYTLSEGFDEASHPSTLLLTNVPDGISAWLKRRAVELGVEVLTVADLRAPPLDRVDDIVVLGVEPDIIESVSPHLANFGILAIIADAPMPRKVRIDVGRVHYDRHLYIGGFSPDIAQAYSNVPVRSALKAGGNAWFLGAGGPMGRMHVQRAIEMADGPKTIFCTALSERRLSFVRSAYEGDAKAKGIAFVCASREDEGAYRRILAQVSTSRFDDVVILAPAASALEEAIDHLAPGGVVNVFAGLARGTTISLDLSRVYLEGIRIIGHSGLTLEDMIQTLREVKSGRLSPGRSVAAVGSLSAAREGLQAVRDARFPGKIVIYPHIRDFPLTALPDLRGELPDVYRRLKDGREWTAQAEEQFLRQLL